SFSLDDFGTGYSSLSYLKKFPIDELKIDRSFLLEVPANQDDNSIVRAIIAMAHSLGQRVVAEGVEEVEQLDFLKQYDCDMIQGYYFSKPLNRVDFTEFLASQGELHPKRQSG
ncbi:MAG: EAL domain-containing protein, partial [Gammaproteobacteria bacterium]|nr:EAL domain-containing protein [Gammaproteobacteria bacterium]